jgi:hypothetical protein
MFKDEGNEKISKRLLLRSEKLMFHRFYHHLQLALLILVGVGLLLSACRPASSMSLTVPSVGVQSPAVYNPTVATTCPAAGTVRQAVMPPLTLGHDANILYVYELGSPNVSKSIIRRYDTVTGRTTNVLSTNDQIDAARISNDGQWVLFTSYIGQENTVQLVRIDGHFQQTLFCLDPSKSIYSMAWSPDQKRVLVNLVIAGTNSQPPNPLEIALLDIGSGRFQTVLKQPENISTMIWVNNTTALLNNSGVGPGDYGSAPLILDLAKGLPQQASTLHQLVPAFACGDYAPGTDGNAVLIAQCSLDGVAKPHPGTITIQSINGGSARTVFSEKNIEYFEIRPISSTEMLFFVSNEFANVGINGVWKVNTDGTHLTRLLAITQQNLLEDFGYAGSTWSTISRDGKMYSLLQTDATHQPVKTSLLLGSVNGGTLTSFASVSSNQASLSIIGWTTM